MNRLIFLIFTIIFSGCSSLTPLQRGKFIAVFHLIETSEFEEAKNIIEEMIEDEQSAEWARTWYARGLLAQTAWTEGKKNNDKKKFELYPDQLFVAIESYEKARELDTKGRFDRQLAPRYVLLANEFQKMGEQHFKEQKYDKAFRAFEQALLITESPILAVKTEKDLIYNTALAAYESNKMEKAIKYLSKLNEKSYSTNVSHLLFTAYLEKGDTLSAEKTLAEGIEKYDDNKDLTLLLTDLLYDMGDTEKAHETLNKASEANPEEYIYPFTKGLIYQKEKQYSKAIEYYKKAVELAPEELMTYVNIATSYYNMGVEIEENTRLINSSRRVYEERERSEAAFESAASWLNKAWEKKPDDQTVIIRLYELYKSLGINDKVIIMQGHINQ
ncbi:MAG: tetratricopeptide repeat protein [Bacteroidales bacterium]|nr:tetratricopeptide repeat protein [Bacteroidales bacterium]